MYRKTVVRDIPGKGRDFARGGRPSGASGGARRRPYSSTGRPSRFGGGRGRGGAPKRGRGFMDESKFINKAQPLEEEAPYVPSTSFVELDIHPKLKDSILKRGFANPTPIQDQAIPHILEGRDVVGLANTGTGKTAAFLIPLINKIAHDRTQKVIILAPTRELAIQIERDYMSLTNGSGIFAVCCVGGAPIRMQMRDLSRGYNLIIGTPGRVKDLVERKAINLNAFQTIVLDEADRMLDMGFIDDMKYVMSRMPANRHTLFFSATLSAEIEKLIAQFLNEPVRVSVRTRDTAKSVDQDVVRVAPGQNKIDILAELLRGDEFKKTLVFGRTKLGVDRITRELNQMGVPAESIHGDKEHRQRQRALKNFTDNKVKALIATDVAARGLHIDGVSHVINYDLPETYEDYVHRIGRTGRAGQTGKALTFIDKNR